MPVRYIKSHPFCDQQFERHLPELSVLFFDPVSERSATPLGDRFRRIDPSLRGNADMFVVRGSSKDFVERVGDDSIFAAIVGTTPTYVLGPGQPEADSKREPSMKLSLLKWSTELSCDRPPIEAFREIEILAILERNEAISDGGADHHFVLPAGYHANEFIRVGDALRDPIEVQRIADWLMPYVRPNSVILADTGSILPLPMALQSRAASNYGWEVVVETLDTYPGDTEGISHAIADVWDRFGTVDPHILFLASVNSSGRLIKIFRSLTRITDEVVIICDALDFEVRANAPNAGVVFARYPIKRWTVDAAGNCGECSRLSRIDIHPRTYQRVPNRDCELVKLSWDKAQAHRSFWELTDARNAVRLHANVGYFEGEVAHSRHLAVYLDIPLLLGDSSFRAACVQKLVEIDKPDHVIVPRHSASETVASLVLEAYQVKGTPITPERVHIVDSGRLSDELTMALVDCHRILIADDALVNGGTLSGLRAEIYRATQQNPIAPTVDSFVIVARPSDKATLETVRRRFRSESGSHFHAGTLVYLPRGADLGHGHESCPWCFEARLLRQYLAKLDGAALGYAIARLEELRGEVRAPVLLSQDWTGSNQTLPVTRGSFFGELHPVAAFAAGASAAQELRTEMDEPAEHGHRRKTVDVKLLLDAYYESILLGAIFRTMPERLLKWAGQEEQVSETIRGLDPSRAYPGAVAEIGWAAISGKLPRRAVAELLARATASDSRLLMLRSILDLQLRYLL